MLITTEIVKIVTQYNVRIFRNHGYKIGDLAIVKIEDWSKNSHEKVNVKCDICGLEKMLSYREYIRSYENNNIYCCSSKCSQFKNKITKLERYGNKNYYNFDKYKSTCLKIYGVDNAFKDKSIINKIDDTKRKKYGKKHELIFEKVKNKVVEKYGVDNISKSEYAKELKKKTCFYNFGVYHPFQSEYIRNKSILTSIEKYGYSHPMQSTIVNNKRINTCIEKYGAPSYVESDDYLFKINSKYGVINYLESDDYLSKISRYDINIKRPYDLLKRWYNSDKYLYAKDEIYSRIKKSNIDRGNWFKPYRNDMILYRRRVDFLTKKNKLKLFENWNGFDYYDNEYIKNYYELGSNSRFYPTIDHKISVLYGFLNKLSIEEVSSIDNLCVTKRYINSSKGSKIENEFLK